MTGQTTIRAVSFPPLSVWIQAARPKTLLASVAPVIMGLAMAHVHAVLQWPLAVLTLLGALCLQVGTNYVNDLYDYLKGADQPDRMGPTRVVQAGLVTVSQMRVGIGVIYGTALVLGGILVWQSGPFIFWIGLLGIGLGVLYTVGPAPLAYSGLSDLVVLIFFGVLAVSGTVYVQTSELMPAAFVAGIGPGLLAVAILTVNNIRDCEQDARAGKKTLVVRFGRNFGWWEYVICLLGAAAVPWILFHYFGLPVFSLLASACCLLGVPLIRHLWLRTGSALNRTLAQTSGLLLLFCLLLSAGWLI